MPLRILGTTNDSEFAGLRALGYSGAVNDMQLQYLIANGFTGALSDMLYDFTLIPPFSLSISLSSIAEDSPAGTSIGTLSSSGGTGPYTYAIDTDADAKFAIGGAGSDELVIRTGASLDYETATSHSVTIEITDTGDSNETYLRTLTIYVTNVIEAPVFTTSPALSPVSVLAGDTVTVTVAVATGGTATTALLANGVDVTGDIVAGDYTTPSGQDTSLTLYAVASNSDGVTEEYAYAEAYALPADTGNDLDYDIDPLTVPVNSAVPTISGTEQVGEDLTTTNGTWSPAASSYAYQWQVSNDGSTGWTNISGATASTFTLTASEESKYVRSGVAGVNAAGTGTMVYSAASGAIAAASGGISAPVLLGTFATTANGTDFETTSFTTTDTSVLYVEVTTTNNDSTTVVMGYTDITIGASGRGYGTGTAISTTPKRSDFSARNNIQVFELLAPAAATGQTVQVRLANTSRDTVIRVWKVEGANRTAQGGATAESSLSGNQASSPISITTVSAGSIVFYAGYRNYNAEAITITGATELDQRTSGGTTSSSDHHAWAAWEDAPTAGTYGMTASWTSSLGQAAVAIEVEAA